MDPEQIALGLLQQILGEQQSEALQQTVVSILQAVNATLVLVRQIVSDLVDPTTGLAAIQAQLATFQATAAVDFTAVLTAIAATQQTGSPVTLPSAYPGSWSSGIGTDSANGVWSRIDAVTGATLQSDLSNLAVGQGNQGTFYTNPGDNDRPFHWIGNVFQTSPWPLPRTFGAEFPANAILASDDLLSFLNSANPGWSWGWDDAGHNWAVASDPANGGIAWYCDIDAAHFRAIQEMLFPQASNPPVWPGISLVTLGTPVALALGVTITEPMDGVLIHITSAPAKQGFFTFDDVLSYRNVGALAFFTDDADEEFPQTLGFQDAIYTPRTMAQAAGVKVRTSVGITGTITPWTVT